MKSDEMLKSWSEMSDEILSGMAEWRQQHSWATFREIEEEVEKRLSLFEGRAHLKKLGVAPDFMSRLVLGSEWLIALSMFYTIMDGGMQSRHPFRNS